MAKQFIKSLRIIVTVLIGLLIATSVASADSAYGSWKLVFQPSSTETYWGQNSVVTTSYEAIAITNVYSFRQIGGNWQLYDVPAGSMAVRTCIVRDYYNESEYTGWQTHSSAANHVGKSLTVTGINWSVYTSKGDGYVYDPYTGSWNGEHIYESRALNFPPSRNDNADMQDVEVPACGFLSDGQSFGYLGMVGVEDGTPDWIAAFATNGERGYIKNTDRQIPMPKDPADAVVNYSELRVKTIPVYESPESEIIVGYYDIYYGGTQDNLDLTTSPVVTRH